MPEFEDENEAIRTEMLERLRQEAIARLCCPHGVSYRYACESCDTVLVLPSEP